MKRPGSYFSEFIPRLFQLKEFSYTPRKLLKDVTSGITVGIVALPLATAFAIASGATPVQGLITAIIAGFTISLLGGSRYQIGGPTGAFVIIIFNIIHRHGMEGLIMAAIIAGLILIIMGLTRIGAMIKFIPYPVITGFTTGIALLIFTSQLKDLFGMPVKNLPADFLEKFPVFASHIQASNFWALSLGTGTAVLILVLRRFSPKMPAAFFALIIGSVIAFFAGLPVETIATRFGPISGMIPAPKLPIFSLAEIRAVFPDAVTIALLAGIESLLSAVVADGMTGDHHHSNMELVAQGAANIASTVFGGIPATGAIARTVTNIRAGAVSPISGIVHSVTLLLILFFLSRFIGNVPLSVLAGVLVVVSYDMSEWRNFIGIFRSPKSDAAVLLITFALTVLIDLTMAVQVGVILSSILFMRRMSEVSTVGSNKWIFETGTESKAYLRDGTSITDYEIPGSVEVYEINGPFFFGVAESLQSLLASIERPPHVFILRMRGVPAIDASGIHAIRLFYEKCLRQKTRLILACVQKQPMEALSRTDLLPIIGRDNLVPNIRIALQKAAEIEKKWKPA